MQQLQSLNSDRDKKGGYTILTVRLPYEEKHFIQAKHTAFNMDNTVGTHF
jgi:hypothetical protein